MRVTATYIGGPTALIEFSGVRFLIDPTFDPAGSSYEPPVYTLRKTIGPALAAEALEPIGAAGLTDRVRWLTPGEATPVLAS